MKDRSEHLAKSNADPETPIKYIVVGASGFVGRNIFGYLREKGKTVIGTKASSLAEGLVHFDLAQNSLRDSIGPEFFRGEAKLSVIIAAVISDMDRCFQDPMASRNVNVDKTIQLIEEVKSLGAKPVFLSSCFVFDGNKGYYTENDAYSPANEYGRHKVEVEKFITAHVPEAFVARLDKIVGDQPNERQLFANWHGRLSRKEPIVCIKGSLLSPTYVLDVAKAIDLACTENIHGIFHVSNSEFFYRDELARQFCLSLGVPPNVISKPIEEFNFPDNRALKSYLDGSRFREKSGLMFTSMRDVFLKFKHQLDAPHRASHRNDPAS
jgi:dTDP-4-dehydrorhamnose reductase